MAIDDALLRAAFDIGTYASAMGWCVPVAEDEDPAGRVIATVAQWPGQSVASVKTRTALLLDRDGEVLAWGDDAVAQWARHRHDRRDRGWRLAELFKMRLGRDDENISHRPLDTEPDDDPAELITKFLRCMLTRFLVEITKSGFGPDDVMYCLTVPNIWNDRQKAIMRRCARNAGLPVDDGRVILALEPEAAAQHARVAGVRVPGSVSTDRTILTCPGRRFVVADCGGGTVDLTSYLIDAHGHLLEAGGFSGDACGGSFVNDAFVTSVLVSRLGGIDRFRKLQEACPEGIDAIVGEWERAKLTVTAENDQPLYFSFSAELYKQLTPRMRKSIAQAQDGRYSQLIVSPDEVRACFERVVTKICLLVSDQVKDLAHEHPDDRLPIVVLLAGGFAASPYLQQRLIEHLGDDALLTVNVEPQAAIVRGAVHFACRPDTRARRARRTYGVEMTTDFREGIDPDDYAVEAETDTGERRKRCAHRLCPLVVKGELVPNGREVVAYGFPLLGDQRRVTVAFYSAEQGVPDHVTDPVCDYLGEVVVDVRPAMRLPLSARSIAIFMKFGETEIACRVVLEATGVPLPFSLKLDAS
jgi:hypothetical protein